jgi:hypothetical protein
MASTGDVAPGQGTPSAFAASAAVARQERVQRWRITLVRRDLPVWCSVR